MSIINKAIEWIKNNKLSATLIFVLAYFFIPQFFSTLSVGSSRSYDSAGLMEANYMMGAPVGSGGYDLAQKFDSSSRLLPPIEESAPVMDAPTRMVITNSSMSILVEDVRETADGIQQKASAVGGYMVTRNINTPYEGGSGYIAIRVPLEKREEMVSYLRDVGVRVISENVDAQDITDQYEDLDAQLAQLERTMTRLEEIYDRAETVNELLQAQTQIQNQQRQIDSVKGRIQALEAKSKTTLISISLSTDELALPYSPGAPWRPEVTFKMAVRELSLTLRDLGDLAIRLAVYSVIWVPALGIFIVVRKMWKNRQATR